MTTNMNFSFTRLMAVMKRDMMENWKTNLYRFIGVYTGAAMAFLFGMYGILSSSVVHSILYSHSLHSSI